MSRIVVIEKNKDGKIELTKEQLQKMLDDAYSQGYSDGNRYDTITYPSYPYWRTTLTGSDTNVISTTKYELGEGRRDLKGEENNGEKDITQRAEAMEQRT